MDVAPPVPLKTRRPLEWLVVVLGALLLAGGLTWFGTGDMRGDQQAYSLLVSKQLDPALFARDVLYRYDPALLHVPWFLELHAWVAHRLGGDTDLALVWLAWPLGALYVGGHYALFRAVSDSAPAAALAVLGAVTIRNSLGGEFWGFDGVPSVASRTIFAGVTPLLLLLFLRWRTRPSFPAFYLLVGALFNVHPVSAYQLAQATGLAHVWLARFHRRSLAQVGGGVVLFGLGTLPYALRFFPARDNLSDPSGLVLARAALDYRFPYLLYPIAPNALVSVAFHVSLLVGVWLWCRRGGPDVPAMRQLGVVMAAAVGLGFLGTAAIQAVGWWRDHPYLDIQQLRTVRLVYPILLTALALAYARLLARRSWQARAALAVLVLASLVPPGAVIHAFSAESRAAVKRALGVVTPAAVVQPAGEDARPAMWAWVVRSTTASSLFLCDDFEFRVRTRRSITGSFKDGALLFLAGSRPFTAWYALDRELAACRAARGRGCWFELARRLGADYAVVDPGLAEALPSPDFVRVWEDRGWSVWQRVPAGRG